MRILLKLTSLVGLLLTVSPAFLHFAGHIEFEQHKWLSLLGTILYLATAPFWMNKKKQENNE